jgi:chromosome segregation ATPase
MAENTRRDAGNNKANAIPIEHAKPLRAPDPLNPHAPDDSGLILHSDEDYADDLDTTGEFPVLVVHDGDYLDGEGEEPEAGYLDDDGEEPEVVAKRNVQTPAERPPVDERTALCLQDLQSELRRLHAKSESASVELSDRDARIHVLLDQAEAKDALAGDLRRQIDELANAQRALETALAQANARVADLGAAQAAHEIDVALAQANLQDARESLAAGEAKRVALSEENAKLGDAVIRHTEAAAGAQRRYEDEAELTSHLRARLQELEAYIDGSNQRWLVLNAELAEYRDWLGVSERREAWALAELTAETKVRKRLAAEAADLERRLVKLVARLAELEHSVRARDETIAGLEESLRQHERAEGELLAQKNDLAERAAALERSLSQRQDVLKLAVERGVQKERDFRDGQQRITRLEGLLREAAHEIDELFTAVEEQEKTISRLETHLHGEQDGHERNGQYADRDRHLVSVDGPTRGH